MLNSSLFEMKYTTHLLFEVSKSFNLNAANVNIQISPDQLCESHITQYRCGYYNYY